MREGIQEVNGTATQETALPMGKGRVITGSTEQQPGKASPCSGAPSPQAEGLPFLEPSGAEAPKVPGKRGNHSQPPLGQLPFSLSGEDRPVAPPSPTQA